MRNRYKNYLSVVKTLAEMMNEMAAGTAQINTALARVNGIGGSSKESIDMLVKEVSRFKEE
jgi:methyl-accepting chemotaxis protein